MNKLAFAANDGIEPASYFPWLANPLACFTYVQHCILKLWPGFDPNDFVNDFEEIKCRDE